MIKGALVLALIVAVGFSAEFCWKNSYGRGAGNVIRTCKSDQEKNGALCYPKCSGDHYGVGPVCWQRCPDGYHDDGAFCRKDVHIYGKGCCCTIFGCCHNCNSGYTDDGCTCRRNAHIFAKHTYGRGAGYPLGCGDNEDLNGALCYNPCSAGHKGVGPVCWGQCPTGWTDCGAGCAPDSHGCADKIIDMVTETGFAVANTVAMVVGANGATKGAQQAAKVAKYAAKSARFAAKAAKYANDIFNSAKAKGQAITEAQAKQMADQTIGQFLDGVGESGAEGWEGAFDAIAKVDPTGFMAAAKSFVHPLCSAIH